MTTFADPEKNVRHLMIEPGMKVADFGAGTGAYVLELAKEVGEGGKVIAIDIQKELLSKTQAAAENAGFDMVEVVWADLEEEEGSTLRENYLDAAVVSNILFQIEDKPLFLREVARVLKPGARLLLIDWTDSHGGLGPKQSHVVDKGAAQGLLEENGFTIEREVPAGAHHYGLLALQS